MNVQTMLNLKLSADDVNKVLAGLNQLPHGQVADLFQNIRIQTVAQLAPQAAEPAPEEKPAE